MTEEDFFVRQARLHAEFVRRLSLVPEVEVQGVIGPDGAGIITSGIHPLPTTVIELITWRVERDEIRTDPLRVEYTGIFKPTAPGNGVWVRGRIAEHPHGGQQMRAEILRECDNAADLTDAAKVLLKPISINHPILGKVALDHKHKWFEGSLKVRGKVVEITLDASGHGPDPEADQTLSLLGRDLASFLRRAYQYAADNLLNLKNTSWKDPDESSTTRDEFIGALVDPQLCVSTGGRFTLYIEAGDLFDGHAVEVRGNAEGEFDEATICG